nr:MAG TPA: hypothetical protein [Caudoviricetes sp.]
MPIFHHPFLTNKKRQSLNCLGSIYMISDFR